MRTNIAENSVICRLTRTGPVTLTAFFTSCTIFAKVPSLLLCHVLSLAGLSDEPQRGSVNAT
jgi:hypothetical protein